MSFSTSFALNKQGRAAVGKREEVSRLLIWHGFFYWLFAHATKKNQLVPDRFDCVG